MHLVFPLTLIALAVVGHTILWVALVNRLHAFAWNRRLIDGLTAVCGLLLVGLPVAVAFLILNGRPAATFSQFIRTAGWVLSPFVLVVLWAGWQRWFAWRADRPGTSVLANHTRTIDVRKLTDQPLMAPGIPKLLSRLPGNQVVCPAFQEKRLVIPSLSSDCRPIKLVHLTDLHMSGRITKQYFVHVVAEVNRWQPDIVAITGDIVERQKCVEWIDDTVGQLRAACGVYFVLGNHDQRVDCQRLRRVLVDCGLHDVGSDATEATVGNTRLLIGGNELPWFGPPTDFQAFGPRDSSGFMLRLLLAHSPDQFAWAQRQDVDLMLAGHCHGGQVRFPLIGPVLAPSLHGTRYTDGVFRSGNTVMHVSRGTSGLAPFRFNCPPEVSLLTLTGAA